MFIIPSAEQQQAILRHWKELLPAPPMFMAYSFGQQANSTGAIAAVPHLQEVFRDGAGDEDMFGKTARRQAVRIPSTGERLAAGIWAISLHDEAGGGPRSHACGEVDHRALFRPAEPAQCFQALQFPRRAPLAAHRADVRPTHRRCAALKPLATAFGGRRRGQTAACAISLTSRPESEERTGVRLENERVYGYSGGAKALPGRPLAPAIAPIRGSRR